MWNLILVSPDTAARWVQEWKDFFNDIPKVGSPD